MSELARPIVRAWEWIGNVGGFPGQVFFVVVVVIVILGGLTWFGNRK
jgi:hypothetical protein